MNLKMSQIGMGLLCTGVLWYLCWLCFSFGLISTIQDQEAYEKAYVKCGPDGPQFMDCPVAYATEIPLGYNEASFGFAMRGVFFTLLGVALFLMGGYVWNDRWWSVP